MTGFATFFSVNLLGILSETLAGSDFRNMWDVPDAWGCLGDREIFELLE